MLRLLPSICFVLLTSIFADRCHAESQTDPDGSEDQVDFNKHIRPILTAHCTACHGGVKQAADLSFVYADAAQGCIEPGDPTNSVLIDRVAEESDDDRMPPAEHGPRLTDQEVALISRWIEQGAQWGTHWAYEKPDRHGPPAISDSDWCRGPIDAFVMAQLDAVGVEPSPTETPERWLRRVTLDLVGLPPTLEQRQRFVDDLKGDNPSELAYRKVVDELLASPALGERWSSTWFDQVRYADSRGYGEDSPRNVWKYRDWVIDALNRDLSYDQFTIKQIAGDLLPEEKLSDRIATAVHRLTHTNEEGGTDDEEFRVVALMDRVSTIWQTWQGTTMGCVQCHHHPYDPFEHDEYYKFSAFFNNTSDCDLSDDWPLIDVPIDPEDYETADRLDLKIATLTHQVWNKLWGAASNASLWQPTRISKAWTSNATKVVVDSKQNWDEYHTVGTVSRSPKISVELPLDEINGPLTGLRITGLPMDAEKALSDSEVGFVMSHVSAKLLSPEPASSPPVELAFKSVIGDEPFPRYSPQESLNEESPDGFGAFTRIHHPRSVVLTLDKPVEVAPQSKLSVTVFYRIFDLAAFALVARRARYEVSSSPVLLSLEEDDWLQAKVGELDSAKRQRSAIDTTDLPILSERAAHLKRPTHVFVRGMYLTKGKLVQPDVPNALRGSTDRVADRLELAKWLVGNENPLTARVAVNRVWAQLFGVGLVATEEDFGSTGEPPSHPELLDDLAVRFRDQYQWSIKRLLREICLSSIYRQCSDIRPDLHSQDPQNRLLARGPRHTLTAEIVRDQMLAISGLLSHKMHGPSVYPPLPSGVWKARRGNWKTPSERHEDRYRRSVYTHVKRSVPFPMQATFDAPSRDFCAPKRLRSNTPLQPLMLLNDRGAIECSRSFASLMQRESTDLRSQLRYGFSRATGRVPRASEIDRLIQLYREVEEEADESLALQVLASLLMNLDEVITK